MSPRPPPLSSLSPAPHQWLDAYSLSLPRSYELSLRDGLHYGCNYQFAARCRNALHPVLRPDEVAWAAAQVLFGKVCGVEGFRPGVS